MQIRKKSKFKSKFYLWRIQQHFKSRYWDSPEAKKQFSVLFRIPGTIWDCVGVYFGPTTPWLFSVKVHNEMMFACFKNGSHCQQLVEPLRSEQDENVQKMLMTRLISPRNLKITEPSCTLHTSSPPWVNVRLKCWFIYHHIIDGWRINWFIDWQWHL